MLPIQTESSSQPPVPSVPSPPPVNYWRSKRVIFSIIGIIVLTIFFVVFLSSSSTKSTKSKSNPPASTQKKQLPKTWEIVFSFDTQKQKLSLKSVAIGEGNAPASPLTLSPYKLLVLDSSHRILFETHIHITEQILYNVEYTPGATASGEFPTVPPTLESIVTIPYFAKGEKIQVTKNEQLVLEFKPPKKLGMHIVPEVFAQASCNALHVVFLSDGYSNLADYRQDAQTFIAAFKATEPYNAHSDIFDFKIIESSEPLGCNNAGVLFVDCLDSAATHSKVRQLTFAQYPDLPRNADLKFVIIVNGGPQPMGFGNFILGAANDVGGDFGVLPTRGGGVGTAIHEVQGHMIGWLYDRYVMVNPDYGHIIPDAKSNCTDSGSGEAFWSAAGGTGSFQGCTNSRFFAPTRPTCRSGGSLLSGGDPNTIMSAAGGCAETAGFDSVERYWIEHKIIPEYQSCASEAPTETPTPLETVTPTPPGFFLSPTPEVTTGGAAPPSRTPTPSRSPTPTPIQYTCREGETTSSTTGLQLKTLICEPRQ